MKLHEYSDMDLMLELDRRCIPAWTYTKDFFDAEEVTDEVWGRAYSIFMNGGEFCFGAVYEWLEDAIRMAKQEMETE